PISTSQIYTLSLHDALPISLLEWSGSEIRVPEARLSDNLAEQDSQKKIFLAGVLAGISGGLLVEGLTRVRRVRSRRAKEKQTSRSEEHTSELQSRGHLVCRL